MTGAYPVLHVGSFGSAGRVPSTRPWARTFRGIPASVPEARRFVAGLLAGCPAREVLMTCVSELSANAIVHTASGQGGVFTVEVSLPHPGVARLAVTDQGSPSVPTPGRLDPIAEADPSFPAADRLDLMAEGGRGLALVAACTTRWGYTDARPGRRNYPDAHPGRSGYADARPGRTVWAEACWPVSVPTRKTSRRPRFFPGPPPIGPSGPAA